MRTHGVLEHALDHSVYSNIGGDDHHDAPEGISAVNTSLVVPGIFVGGVNWDISIPDEANVAKVFMRSNKTIQNGGAKAGAIILASDTQFAATGFTWGGYTTIGITAINMVYSKAASAANLTDKIFSSTGADIAVTQAFITGSPGSRVLRIEFTNYAFSSRLLNAWVEVAIIG